MLSDEQPTKRRANEQQGEGGSHQAVSGRIMVTKFPIKLKRLSLPGKKRLSQVRRSDELIMRSCVRLLSLENLGVRGKGWRARERPWGVNVFFRAKRRFDTQILKR